MTQFKNHEVPIPQLMLESWQNIVNLLAELVDVPAALIMRAHPDGIEVHTSSDNIDNPYQAQSSEAWQQNLYCESVLKQQGVLVVPNALKDPKFDHNPDLRFGMLSYCGLPLLWPNGEPFGTICMLDNKENQFGDIYRRLLSSFKISIESQLATLHHQERLTRLNQELRNRVENRTLDLANMSYSLNQEIDRRKLAERQIQYQKNYDQGTGFLNRAALESELEKQLYYAQQSNQLVVVIHVGFANARGLQTKYGFDLFDEVLKQYRERVGTLAMERLITARPSSNDLVLAFVTQDIHADCDIILSKLLEVGHTGFVINSNEVHLHSFIGLASSRDCQPRALLRHANQAMVVCKDSGDRYTYYLESHSDRFVHHNQIESYLLQAVRNDDLLLYFQPKVCPETRRWIGAEALLRWRHPVLGDISNEALIRMAEQNGLIFEVGAFVLRSAVEKAKEWQESVKDFRVAVNVSPIQLKNAHFSDQVKHILDIYHLPANCLELEVTESGLIADEALAHDTLNKLNKLGVTLSLDDFGTGYASFSYLKKFPFDAIKIDKSFVQHMDNSEQDKEIIRSIIHVAKKLELHVIMEGIETESQEQFLINEGCDFGQGYLYGKPMPSNEFELGLNQHNHITFTRPFLREQ